MHRIAVLAAALFAALQLTGCTSVMPERDQQLTAGRYAEMERGLEAETSDITKLKTAKLSYLCQAYSKLKRYNKLFPCLDQLEENFKKGDISGVDMAELRQRNPLAGAWATFSLSVVGGEAAMTVVPTASLMRAEAHLELGEARKTIEEAERAMDRAAKGAGATKGVNMQALGLIGLAYSLLGDRASALKTAQRLDGIYTGYPFILLAPTKHGWLAKIYMSLGDYRKALEFMQIAYPISDIVKGVGNLTGVLIATTNAEANLFAFEELPRQFMLAKALLETGNVADARARYDALLKHPNTRQNGEIYWLILYDRGRIAEKDGDRSQAIRYYRDAVEVIEAQRASINTESSKIGFVGNKQAVYGDLIGALIRQGQVATALDYVERSKARALVDMLASKQDFALSSSNPDQVRSLLRQVADLEQESRVQDVAAGEAQARTRTLDIAARRQLAEQAPELASLVSVTTLTTPEIQKRIPGDETLIEYYYIDKSLHAFVITSSGLSAQILDGAGLAEAVQSFRQEIQNADSQAYRASAQRLHTRLLHPLEPLLKTTRLTIVAHGALHYLPFNALHDGRQFLIERYGLRLLPAASVLKFLKEGGSARPGELLAFGNPDLGNPRLDLAFAQAEAEQVARSMPKSRALVRTEATETAFKQFSTGFRYLHIASHGQFNPEAPLESALMLARDSQNDGMLTVGELYSTRISADLVTLSACETGLGKIASGDDVVGLTRGFLYAGATSIVASLWQVDDKATGEMMTAFYEALRGGSDKRESLRRAQLSALKSYPHPYYWAAFQLTGRAD